MNIASLDWRRAWAYLAQEPTGIRPAEFRFYGEDGFFPEIHLCGKRLVFADHVLQRFSSRTQRNVGEDLSNFLLTFYGAFSLAMPVGPGRAFVSPYFDTILAFPHTETETEFFVTTCLTINEINSMEREVPPQASNLHYGPAFITPRIRRIRNWVPARCMFNFYKCWERKIALPPPQLSLPKTKWHCFANLVKDFLIEEGHGPGSSMRFVDGIPGPCSLDLFPGKSETRHNELEFYKQAIRDSVLRR
ncbi:MAG: hypothetical protein JWR69_2753 [Pedosphaera sp.]|nr:hypothetical protein [Pedosphaera sp.]